MSDNPNLEIEIRLYGIVMKISGTPSTINSQFEEITKVIDKFSSLEKSLNLQEKNNFYSRSNPQEIEKNGENGFFQDEKIDYDKLSLRERIRKLIEEGYFDKPITAEGIRSELESRGLYHETRRISSELTRSFVRKNIIRRSGLKGKYSYIRPTN
ncbi:MAG: hypothetical protein ACTSUV_04810 [Candidatus Ranarchaeia archaeon]